MRLRVIYGSCHSESFRDYLLPAAGIQAHYLFPGITQRLVQVAVWRACVAAGLRARSPHDLRHTYATILLMAHISPAYVQKQLGHHSISMTVDIYGHWIPGEGKKDMASTLRGPRARRRNLSLAIGDQESLESPVELSRGRDDVRITGDDTGD